FESWRYPLIIMVTVPLAAMGSLWAMFLTGTNLGVASLIGVMMLVGVVVNNGIVLVDYTGILARRGMPVRDAVVTAARRRLRPVPAMGSLGAMILAGTGRGVASLVGVMMLVGVGVNNGIVLVDYTGILARRGMPVRDAVVTAARRRLRPVLMTAITTIGGMIPMALGQEQGMELQGPLAITVIGSLTASTVLTLFVVP